MSDNSELSTIAGPRPAPEHAGPPPVDEVMSFIRQALGEMNYDVAEIDGDTLLGPAGIDLESLAVVELSFRLEDAYGARFNEEDMERLAVMTLAELVSEVIHRANPAG